MGDALSPWLIERIARRHAQYVSHQRPIPKYFVTGSILTLADQHATVWGAGIAWRNARIRPNARIVAVRGPRSLERARAGGASCSDVVMGDPALLLPRLYTPQSKIAHPVGLVPHLVDYDRARALYRGALPIVDVRRPPTEVVEQICACERIVSSSLHGLIIATAYRIPVRWAELSDKVIGDGTKFADFFASVGIEGHAPLDLRHAQLSVADLSAEVPPFAAKVDTDPLWNACPFAPP